MGVHWDPVLTVTRREHSGVAVLRPVTPVTPPSSNPSSVGRQDTDLSWLSISPCGARSQVGQCTQSSDCFLVSEEGGGS